MKRDPIDQGSSNPAAVRRIQRAIAECLQQFTGATVVERVTAIYRIAQAATESVIEHSDPLQRAENKRVMREVLGDILMRTLDVNETVH